METSDHLVEKKGYQVETNCRVPSRDKPLHCGMLPSKHIVAIRRVDDKNGGSATRTRVTTLVVYMFC